MFVVTYEDIDASIINSMNGEFEFNDIRDRVFTVYKMKKNFELPLTNFRVNLMVIDLSEESLGDLDIDELLLNILEAELTPIIRLPEDEELKAELLDCIDIYKVKYLDYERMTLQGEVELSSLMEYSIIDEIFNENLNKNYCFSVGDYATKIVVRDDRVIVGESVIDLKDFDVLDMYSYIDVSLVKKLKRSETFLSGYLVSPVPFALLDSDDVIERVNTFKQNVFYKAMNLSAREISKLPLEIANLYTKAGYIPLDKLKPEEERIKKLLG